MTEETLSKDVSHAIFQDVVHITDYLLATSNKFFLEYKDNEHYLSIFTSATISYCLTVIDKLAVGFKDHDVRDEYLEEVLGELSRNLELMKHRDLGHHFVQH